MVLGLLLVPNGKALGRLMGDKYYEKVRKVLCYVFLKLSANYHVTKTFVQEVDAPTGRMTSLEDDYYYEDSEVTPANMSSSLAPEHPADLYTYHPWGIFFTIIGTVLLDFDADACQSPSRAYLLDVTLPGIYLVFRTKILDPSLFLKVCMLNILFSHYNFCKAENHQ